MTRGSAPRPSAAKLHTKMLSAPSRPTTAAPSTVRRKTRSDGAAPASNLARSARPVARSIAASSPARFARSSIAPSSDHAIASIFSIGDSRTSSTEPSAVERTNTRPSGASARAMRDPSRETAIGGHEGSDASSALRVPSRRSNTAGQAPASPSRKKMRSPRGWMSSAA